jgi:two-component system cell cycle response regulator
MISSTDIRRGKILIVDDERANVVLLERVLAGAGYVHVSSTMDPTQVCDLHRDNDYDLILLDIQMPRMDGFQVMEGLMALETDGYLPVLAITAQPAHKIRALRDGAKDFIGKPFDLAEVRMRVHNMLEVRLLHRASRDQAKMLESLALNDALTGLANRRLLDERLAVALVHARRNKSAMALVFLDLDGFKRINDTLGHPAGDVLLKTVAARLMATVREEDTVARLGGDEFVIAMWHLSGADQAEAVAGKVIAALSESYVIDGHTVGITASAGVGIYPMHGEDAASLMKSADLALYEAKRAGKNAYRVHGRAKGPSEEAAALQATPGAVTTS